MLHQFSMPRSFMKAVPLTSLQKARVIYKMYSGRENANNTSIEGKLLLGGVLQSRKPALRS